MAFGTFVIAAGLATFAAPSPPPAARPTPPDPATWAAAFDKLAAADRNVSRASFEPAAVIESVGRDPAALMTWVRGNIAWAPYQGELKGAAGTMMDRAGSSLDRTLLLAELMRLSGYEVQLAHATLAEKDAAELLASSRPPTVAAAPAGDAAPPADLEIAKRIADQIQKIHAAIGAGARPSNDDVAKAARSAAADHWWVRWQQGGTWVDADLTVDQGKPARTKASETFPYVVSDGAVSLPAKYAHRIEVGLVIEVWEDDQKRLVEKPVVKAPLRAADLLGRRVMLRHHVLKSTAKPPAEANDDKSIRAAALAASEWLPTLDVGGRRLAKASFSAGGQVSQTADLSGAAQVGGASRGMFGGFGGALGGGGGGAAAESKSALVAEWLQFTIAAPGRAQPRIVRREIFDLIGPAARSAGLHAAPQLSDSQRLARALSLAGTTEILAIGCSPSPQFVAHTMAARTLDQRGLCLRMIALPEGPERRGVAGLIHPLTPVLAVACLRRTLSPVRDQACLDGINVIDFRTRLVEGADGALRVENGIDLAVNDVGVLGTDGAAAFDGRIAQGVADTAAESVVLAGADASTENTLGLLGGAAAPGLVAARGPTDPAVSALAVPADARARMLADLGSGAVIVLPDRLPLANSPRVGWWKIDPDGSTVGVMDNGFRSDITENAYLEGDTVIREAGLEPTYIRPPGGPFWRQSPHRIIQLLGGDPNDFGLLEMVVDLQSQMLESGIWL